MQNQSFASDVAQSLKTPFSTDMSWSQLAAVIVFVTVVLFAWRQVVLMINAEV